MHDGEDAGAREVVLLDAHVIGEEACDVRRAGEKAFRRLVRHQRVDLAGGEHVGEIRAVRDHRDAHAARLHADHRLGVVGVRGPATPVDVGRAHAVLVLQHAARDQRRGHRVFAHAHGPADQVARRADAPVGAHEERRVAEHPRREHRQRDVAAVAGRREIQEVGEAELGEVVRIGVERLGEQLLQRRTVERRVEAGHGDAPVDERLGAVVASDAYA